MQKFKNKKISYFFGVVLLTTFFLVLQPFSKQIAYCAYPLEFTLSSGDYIEGTWTNKNVEIKVENFTYQENYLFEYRLNENEVWTAFENSFEINKEGEFLVEVRATSEDLIYQKTMNVKIDKTPPTNIIVFLSTEEYTKENVILTVIGEDDLSGISIYNSYRIKDYPWQSSNQFEIQSNTKFEIGDIQVRDQAGNVAHYLSVLEIKNIDKNPPLFRLEANTIKPKSSDIVKIIIENAISGVKKVYVQKVGSNEIIDITSTYQNGFKITKNGEYIFTVVNNLDVSNSVGIIYNNINQNLISIIVSILSAIIVGVLILISHQIKFNKKKKRWNKRFF